MDSLAQIVLGAAVGEATLGKKIGNRAMLWGAIGGTIPDLDVLGGMFLNDLDNLAFHRGFSHSIFFGIIGAFVFGWLVHWQYKSKYHKQIAIASQFFAFGLVVAALNFVLRIFFPGNYWPLICLSLVLLALLLWYFKGRYFSGKWVAPNASIKDWRWLMFWSLFTHPLLDCFTTYGTQLFNPVSNYRVAFNTVSVMDFTYTLPFLICVLVAAGLTRASRKRRNWNIAGLIISCTFLLFTVFNKFYINSQFEKAYVKQGIPVQRYTTSPTILNNILWGATLETDSLFYLGQYSWFDEVPISFNPVAKGHELVSNIDADPTMKKLRWFSKDYFCLMDIDSAIQYNDLRFGTFYGKGESPDDYIFNFHLHKLASGLYEMKKGRQGPKKGGANTLWKDLWGRVGGLKE